MKTILVAILRQILMAILMADLRAILNVVLVAIQKAIPNTILKLKQFQKVDGFCGYYYPTWV